jgi:hypothetical protein
MATTVAPSVEDIRRLSQERGVEFYFAQFVDMYARPSAKLVPAVHLDDLVTEGAGFAGFAAGEIGQVPSDPDIAAIPDLRSYTPVPWEPSLARFACDITVEGEEWPYDPRTILRRQLESPTGYEFMMGLELEYFLLRSDGNGGIKIADELDDLRSPATTQGPDAQLRVPAHGLELRQRSRLGLTPTPRGRQRAVRAELPPHRCPHERPRDLLPLHGAHAAQQGPAGDLHAEAVHRPDRKRVPLPPVLWDGDTNLF